MTEPPSRWPCVQRADVEREARRFADASGLAVDWDAVDRLDDDTLVNAITQVAPFDVGAKQALLEEADLAGRAELVVQLMQFQRLAPGGADVGPDASVSSDRQAAQQQRQVAAGAARFGHQPVLDRTDAVDQAHAEAADRRTPSCRGCRRAASGCRSPG